MHSDRLAIPWYNSTVTSRDVLTESILSEVEGLDMTLAQRTIQS